VSRRVGGGREGGREREGVSAKAKKINAAPCSSMQCNPAKSERSPPQAHGGAGYNMHKREGRSEEEKAETCFMLAEDAGCHMHPPRRRRGPCTGPRPPQKGRGQVRAEVGEPDQGTPRPHPATCPGRASLQHEALIFAASLLCNVAWTLRPHFCLQRVINTK
jgi:hypothetical protein